MPPEATISQTPEPKPSVIVSHLDIVYEVYGAKRGRPAPPPDEDNGLRIVQRLLGGQPDKLAHVQKVHAVKDVSFVANVGESIGIIGRNGSGKSTLLRAIAGLIPPTGGSVWLSGEPSLLGVNAVLLGDLTGERNIMIGGQALGLSPKQVRARFDDIVEFSGIGDFVYLPMKAYSSGMGARLRFAISTAKTPDILMVDEALATGDADFKVRSTDRISQIREEAGTVFLVSHSNNTVRDMCSRALWMDKGRLIADGPAADVVAEYQKTFPQKRKASAPPKPAPQPQATGAAPSAPTTGTTPDSTPTPTPSPTPDSTPRRASDPTPSPPPDPTAAPAPETTPETTPESGATHTPADPAR
ncbi:ABC transporter ATP-binding protein [Intrasporangium sp.]|uniref:ABC transporter ATP-binding protein n=1 Tax=Intrasporangium sp. TaxID=1925024 RepID=UPI00293B981B|nr:ABC transporter ATP-binding protein [Intrasporangium sp.]